MNDTRYLLPLAEKLEADLRERGRWNGFSNPASAPSSKPPCSGCAMKMKPGALPVRGSGRTSAMLRELWQWRDKEAQAADRPAFHVLQNHLLLEAAQAFAAGQVPDFRHFSARRRRVSRRAEKALQLPESEWPPRRFVASTPANPDWRGRRRRCVNVVMSPPSNSGWILPSLRHARRSNAIAADEAGARLSLCRGNAISCSSSCNRTGCVALLTYLVNFS